MSENEIIEGYLKLYSGFSNFIGSEEWKLCVDFIQKDHLLKSVKFANDYLGIPPVKSFVRYHREFLTKDHRKINAQTKRGIGAFWGYVFRSLLSNGNEKYVSSNVWVGETEFGLKTASIFLKERYEEVV